MIVNCLWTNFRSIYLCLSSIFCLLLSALSCLLEALDGQRLKPALFWPVFFLSNLCVWKLIVAMFLCSFSITCRSWSRNYNPWLPVCVCIRSLLHSFFVVDFFLYICYIFLLSFVSICSHPTQFTVVHFLVRLSSLLVAFTILFVFTHSHSYRTLSALWLLSLQSCVWVSLV